jgi:hypothetical protein
VALDARPARSSNGRRQRHCHLRKTTTRIDLIIGEVGLHPWSPRTS